jgi:hypothetical protein
MMPSTTVGISDACFVKGFVYEDVRSSELFEHIWDTLDPVILMYGVSECLASPNQSLTIATRKKTGGLRRGRSTVASANGAGKSVV